MITKKLHGTLSAEINELLKDYDKFRKNLAKDPLQNNALSKAIKEEEKIWENKIAAAKLKIKNLKISVPEKQNDTVSFGSRVVIMDENNKIKVFILDGAWCQLSDSQVINYKAPLAQRLIGKKAGEVIDGKRIVSTKCPWW